VISSEAAAQAERLAYILAHGVDGEEARLAGHRITIYRKEPDGCWVLARDTHTLSPVEKIRS
jgi:ketosteroid isomerase-like protein